MSATGRSPRRQIGRGLEAILAASPAPGGGAYDQVAVVDPRSLAEISQTIAESQAAPATRASYGAVYRRLVALAGPGAGAGDLTRELVVRYRNGRERDGCQPATIARELSAIRVLVRKAGGSADALDVKSPKVPDGKPRPLTDGQLARLLAAPDQRTIEGVRDHAIILVMSRAGLRREEVTALDVDSIRERRRHPDGRIRAAVDNATGWVLVVANGKGGKSREVPIAQPLVDALARWQRMRPAAATPALFVSVRKGRTPERLSTKAINRLVTKAAAAAELPDGTTPHTLRHTFGSRLGRRNVPLDVIAGLLGHEDVRTALVYTDRGEDAGAAAIDDVERAVTGLERLAAASA
jgi:site-specific recombinase XerC